jgi:hypothetical protein
VTVSGPRTPGMERHLIADLRATRNQLRAQVEQLGTQLEEVKELTARARRALGADDPAYWEVAEQQKQAREDRARRRQTIRVITSE